MTLPINNGNEGGPPGIGVSIPRADAYMKVSGREKYASDYYGEDLVWCGVKRAGVPHVVIGEIHTRAASETPGVLAVLTHSDVRGTNRQGVLQKDQPVLADDKARHCGDAVALVIAEDRHSLNKALDLVSFDYELLPGVFDAEEALEEGAPILHENHPQGNLLLSGEYRTGAGASAMAECDVVVEGSFRTPRQEHAYLETEAGWAQVQDDGRLFIVCSTQTPFRDRSEVAEALGLDLHDVRIKAPYPGGAFGGKDGVTVQTLLGLAALNSGGRPVRMQWDREESFLAGTKRHPARLYYRLGAKRDGTLHCLDVHMVLDTGPYDHLGGVVLALGLEHAGGAYRVPHVNLKGKCVYTNNPVGGAFRGFGVPQVTAAIEQMIDMTAEKLQMDPLETRLRNAVRRGDKNSIGKTLVNSTGLRECLKALGEHPLWKSRAEWKAGAGAFKRRGAGVAALTHASGYGPVVPDVANAKVELTREGKFLIYSGVVDMGQGNATTNLQIAGSILCQPTDGMELVLPDTDRTLPSGSASASRCTYTFGNALIGAAENLKTRILQRAADLLMARSRDEIVLIPGGVRHLVSGKDLPLSVIAGFMDEAERISVHHFKAPTAPENFDAGPGIRMHGFPHTLFSYAAHLALVEVDELTGEITVCRYVAISDCGTVVNPQIYEQQIQGAVAQGIGFALCEDLVSTQGLILTQDFAGYVIPTAADVPEIDSVPVEIFEPSGPFGLKGVGEIAMNGPLPAISNAVADACGVRIFEYPMTPERVLAAIRDACKRISE
ncbi:MAG: xanthine dehydrogenase family protein molybdopterin-binding subunit [Desulfomonilaceae bacterium]|nr:xanthine dehydrogenase family protein molybdopterin-binding subunit [Desulfomonilaceae bacterium]